MASFEPVPVAPTNKRNRLIRVGYTQIIPANPGRPPTPERTVVITQPVTSAVPATGGSYVTLGTPTGGGSYQVVQTGGNGSYGYGGGTAVVWVPSSGIPLNGGIQLS